MVGNWANGKFLVRCSSINSGNALWYHWIIAGGCMFDLLAYTYNIASNAFPTILVDINDF